MLKYVMNAGLALALAAGSMMVSTHEAEARGGRRAAGAVAGAIIGLGVLGAYAASRDRGYGRSCYPGHRRCEVVGQRCWYNRYGEYVCRDKVNCWRPRYCD